MRQPTAGEHGRQNLAALDKAIGDAIRGSAPHAPRIEPGVAALGQRMHGWFTPRESLLQEAGLKDVPWTSLLPAAPLLEQLLGVDSGYSRSAAATAWSIASDLDQSIAPGASPNAPDLAPIMCFGACGGSHERAHLHSLIGIEHLASGVPSRWWIERSSGFGKFDNTALESVVTAARYSSAEALGRGARPTRSVWMFSATAYQWSRKELLLDPLFDPPGYEVDETSNAAGVTSIVTAVRLVAVRYRDEPASER